MRLSAWVRSVIGVAGVLALAQVFGLHDGLNRWLTDAHWRMKASLRPEAFPADIVVIGIDDKTVREFGRLRYWSRTRYAELLDNLREAKAVGLDILFTEPDLRDPEGDRRLVESVRAHGRVVVACYEWREVRPFSSKEKESVEVMLNLMPTAGGGTERLQVIPSQIMEPPIYGLMEGAAGIGSASVNSDPDGVYRSPVILKRTGEGRLAPHLSLAMACVAADVSLDAGFVPGGRDQEGSLRIRNTDGVIHLQPMLRRGGTHSKGPGVSAPVISFVDALKMTPEEFAGKMALIGETATGTSDIRPNPLDSGLRGVELNAEILANYFYSMDAERMPMPLQWALIIAAVGIPIRLYDKKTSRIANMGVLVALALVLGVMEAAFWVFRMIPAWSPVLVGLVTAAALAGAQRYAREEADKQELRRSFSSYVAPELVEAIVENPEIARQEGTRRSVAVLFSDIRQFTAYCEQHSPEFVVNRMREYLDTMTEAVDDNGGVLDKYIGDAVMALFGPFLAEGANRSALAISCALDMQDRLEQLNAEWRSKEIPEFKIGIGIHDGEAIVGNVGAPRRMQYTALGDTVNLASRLQSMTKELCAGILVTEEVRNQVEGEFGVEVRFISKGTLGVRGREKQAPVYEVRRETQEAYADEQYSSGQENKGVR